MKPRPSAQTDYITDNPVFDPSRPGNSEIRKHYFLDRYVVIAPKRNLRPDSFAVATGEHKTETSTSRAIEKDPAIFEIKGPDKKWQVKAIDNAYPALSLDNPKAFGKQEIIIETPDHNVEFSELPIAQIERVFEAYINRTTTLKKLHGIRYVSVFKNDGPKAGASIAHAHSQVAAVPIVPPHIVSEAEQIQAYMIEHQTCPHCDVISWERQQKVRVIFEDKHILAISPYATRYPFGVWILPKMHKSNFSELSGDERHSIATILKKITASLDTANISFNYFLHDSLDGFNHHFILQVEPRVTIWAGFEVATGLIINPVPPEYAAMWYNGKVK